MNPFYFGSSAEPLLGVYHSPNVQSARDSAVLLCPPIAQEYILTHWSYRRLADMLANEGFDVLRFDYFGTGDSAGHSKDATIEIWHENIKTAANELLELSGLPITVSIRENERILARKPGSDEYSIAELSDGERNALLIAAAVLTAKPNTLILIDEPERHLHRSIISPLLTHLFARRRDCAFIVSTHEVLLPIDHPDSMTLLVRSCSYQGKNASGWEIDIVTGENAIPEDIKLDIYGARRRLLFVEGTEESLDKPLYGLLFPQITVVPKGNCREVERSTIGVRAAADLNWVHAYGLVDSDGRGHEDRRRRPRRCGCARAP